MERICGVDKIVSAAAETLPCSSTGVRQLEHRVGADDDPGKAGSEQDGSGQHPGQGGHGEEPCASGEHDEPESHERSLSDASRQRSRGRPTYDGADALYGDDNAEEGGALWRPWLTTAKAIDSAKPTTNKVTPPAMTIWRSTIELQM